MGLVIRRKISLEFLGDEYKDAYLSFKSISVKEYEGLQDKIKSFEKNQAGSIDFMLDLLKKHFLDGKFPNEKGELQDVTAEDLDDLDPNSMIECFKGFTGQDIDPKDESSLATSLPTAESPPQNT